jgi:hypothetical protein
MSIFGGENAAQKEDEAIINRLLGIIEGLLSWKRQPPKLAFNISIKNKNLNFMAVVTSLNLTSAAPVQLFMTVVDASGNPIAGVLSGLSYAVADPTADVAVVDSTTPTDGDIHAVSSTGGTSVTPSGTFVSTLLQADGVTPVFSGPVTGPALTLTNNIPVTTLTPSLAFNQ